MIKNVFSQPSCGKIFRGVPTIDIFNLNVIFKLNVYVSVYYTKKFA